MMIKMGGGETYLVLRFSAEEQREIEAMTMLTPTKFQFSLSMFLEEDYVDSFKKGSQNPETSRCLIFNLVG